MIDPAELDPTTIDLGDEAELDARGLSVYVERHRDRTWHLPRGLVGERRRIATLELLEVDRWIVSPSEDPHALRAFTDIEAALRYAITR